MVRDAKLATYSGLILVWAVPFLLFLWYERPKFEVRCKLIRNRTLAYQFILALPFSNTAIPIVLPTLYLWIVDTLALKRGTWVISPGTKLGVHLWDGLEIEEALFFLLTNTMIVFGQLAFDNALAILAAFPGQLPECPPLPPPRLLARALALPVSQYDEDRIVGLKEAVARLKKKSRSFYLASSAFQGQIRTDLLLLYSFCRVADDLVDDASSTSEARDWISKLQNYLAIAFAENKQGGDVTDYIRQNFPPGTQSALKQLPVTKLSREPLDDLLHGFEMDLTFSQEHNGPIQTEEDLDIYAHRVAGTVAHMCIELIFHDYDSQLDLDDQRRVVEAGDRMGIALQCVNIARDISVDGGGR